MAARNLIDQNIWVEKLRAELQQETGPLIVTIDDVRMVNEAQMVLYEGGILIHIDRLHLNFWQRCKRYWTHPSEQQMSRVEKLCTYRLTDLNEHDTRSRLINILYKELQHATL
jgi:hypothetical protein